jgi:hypothetical protein
MYLLTINNHIEHGLTREKVIEIIEKYFRCQYYCLSEEIGEQGTPHMHIFLYHWVGEKWDIVKKIIPQAHIDVVKGTAQENIDYIKKQNKWLNSEKGTTKIEGSFYESGFLYEHEKHTTTNNGRRNAYMLEDILMRVDNLAALVINLAENYKKQPPFDGLRFKLHQSGTTSRITLPLRS